jgi:hypothetical protein
MGKMVAPNRPASKRRIISLHARSGGSGRITQFGPPLLWSGRMTTLERLRVSRWPIWACRAAGIAFTYLGLIVLVLYVQRGWSVDPESLPYSLRVPPLHAWFHLVVGVVALYVGYIRTTAVIPFLRAFSVIYIALGAIGTFSDVDLGLGLGRPENTLHWSVGLALAVIAILLPRSGDGAASQ